MLPERARLEESVQDNQGVPVLPQRAASERPRWTAAVGTPWLPCLKRWLPWKGARSMREVRGQSATPLGKGREDEEQKVAQP